jgi:hypothetical protein
MLWSDRTSQESAPLIAAVTRCRVGVAGALPFVFTASVVDCDDKFTAADEHGVCHEHAAA